MGKPVLIPIDAIQDRILLIRGQRVMMDYDLASLYGVTTARLNEQVRRNAERFPEDFMFQLGKQEFAALMSQIATSNSGRGGRRNPHGPCDMTRGGGAVDGNPSPPPFLDGN